MDEKFTMQASSLHGDSASPTPSQKTSVGPYMPTSSSRFRRLLIYIVSLTFSVYALATLLGTFRRVNADKICPEQSLAKSRYP